MISLFEHNRTAYESAAEMLRQTGKAAIVHPTGTGKSFIGFKLCEDNADKTIAWLSPSEYIFRTQLENLKSACEGAPQNVKFFTYAKLMLMSETELLDVKPDYIILDEFHRCGAEMWGRGVQSLLNIYPEAPILGLSATAIRYLDNQRDMADELFDGCIASEMTLGEAIVRGILNPPKYVLSIYSYQKDLERYEQRIKGAKNNAVKDAAEKYYEALRRALDKADGLDKIFSKHMADKTGKYIVFCSGIEHMRQMIAESKQWFANIDASPHIYSVYSDDPEASQSFADFKADNDNSHLRLLFCIDALNEGIHVENISGVILLRPTVSPIIYKQQIGRALSAAKTHNAVIFDIVNNISGLYSIASVEEEMQEAVRYYDFLGESGYIINETFGVIDEAIDCKKLFDKLEDILSASWDYMYQEAERYVRENGNLLTPQSYVTENGCKLGQWISTQRLNYRKGMGISEARIKKLEAIGMSWQTQHERLWEDGYRLAENYYNTNGNLNVSPLESSKLSLWLIRQRQKYREGQLSDEQYTRLSSIGMVWELEDAWEAKFQEAKKYFEKHGNLDVPAAYITPEGTALGAWCRSVRDQYRVGTLGEDRIRSLEGIGMKWTSVVERNWNNFYSLAADYYNEHGNLNIHTGYLTNDGTKLGVWISTQRTAYKKGRLTDEQIRRLESIGMVWQRFAGKWEEAYGYADSYYLANGDLNPTADYVTDDGFALGAWVAAQRRKYSSGKLSEARIARLEALGIAWNPAEESWNEGLEHARAYKELSGDINVPTGYVCEDGYLLGAWIANQRTRHKSGKLTAERTELLEKLGISWNIHNEKWNLGYDHAKNYRIGGGLVPIPASYIAGDGYPLGEWMRAQERRYRSGRLETDKVRKLAEIGVVFRS